MSITHLGGLFLRTTMDIRFFKLPITLTWLILGGNLYFYYYYKNNLALVLAVLSFGILIRLFEEDCNIFNLYSQRSILETLINYDNCATIIFDQNKQVIFHNNTWTSVFPECPIKTLGDILKYFQDRKLNIEEISNGVAKLNKQTLKLKISMKINDIDYTVVLQPLHIHENMIYSGIFFSLSFSPQNLLIERSSAVMDDILLESDLPCAVVDFRRRIVFCNKALAQLVGLSISQLKYKEIVSILAEQNNIYDLFNDEQNKGLILLKSKGGNREYLWQKEVIRKPCNKDWHIFFRFSPPAPEMEDKQEAAIIAKTSLPIVLFNNHNYNIALSNNSFQNIVNSKIHQETKITDFIPMDILSKIIAKSRAVLGENHYDLKLEDIGNNQFNSKLQSVRIFSVNAGLIHGLIIVDTTEFFLQYQQLLHAQRLMTTGEIISGVIHDLNNYLMSMLGYAESIFGQMNIYDPMYTNMMHLQNNAIKASNLIRYLLNMSRKEDSSQQYIANCNSKISDLLRLMAKILGKNIDIKFQHENNSPSIAMGDIHFEQIITNILINSRDAIMTKIKNNQLEKGLIYISTSTIHYTPASGNGEPANHFKISIIDNGIGIQMSNMRKIFDPFFSTKKQGGVGLGLSTVRKIVEEYKGVINVESQENIGTTMTILIPTIDRSEIKASSDHQNHNPYITGRTDVLLDSGTILLLEDEQSIRRLLNTQLQRIGYDVIEAENGKEALGKTIEYQGAIDVLISDVMLPDMSLVELCLKVREQYPNIIIILTSGTTEDQVQDIVGNSFQYTFFNKPFPLKTFFSKIQQLKAEQKAKYKQNTPAPSRD